MRKPTMTAMQLANVRETFGQRLIHALMFR